MTTGEQSGLECSYTEQKAAKAAGTQWDRTRRGSYAAPRNEHTRTIGTTPPRVLPSEDRSFSDGSFVDLIPDLCWFTNGTQLCQPERRSCVGPLLGCGLRAVGTLLST